MYHHQSQTHISSTSYDDAYDSGGQQGNTGAGFVDARVGGTSNGNDISASHRLNHQIDQLASSKFAHMGQVVGRIWVVPSIHGCAEPLCRVHDYIYRYFCPGDRIIYLGNYTGYGPESIEVIDEILTFRRSILSIPAVFADEITYLRGRQEEMVSKLLQLQFAPNPSQVMQWVLNHGGAATLSAYGVDLDRSQRAAREGVVGIGCWTRFLRNQLNAPAGHRDFRLAMKRAAFTDMEGDYPHLFVPVGVDAARPLHMQGDNFLWSDANFNEMAHQYHPFARVIRGFDPQRQGWNMTPYAVSCDNGCGSGGTLALGVVSHGGKDFHFAL